MRHGFARSRGTERTAARREPCRGAILGVVLIVLLVLSILGMGLLSLSAQDGVEAGRAISAAQAFWTAEAGVEHVKALAQKNRRPLSMIACAGSPSGFLFGANALTGTTSRGAYAVEIMDDPSWTNAAHALKKYLIRCRGVSSGGLVHTVTVQATIQSYASYIWASNYERNSSGPIWFVTGDILDGPVYVNDQLNISGNSPGPIFRQEVRSATNSVNYAPGATAVFGGGLVLNATPLDIGGRFTSDHINYVQAQAASGGLVLSGDQRLTFNANGSFTYQAAGGGPIHTNYLSALNGAIYVAGNVSSLAGAVNGNVTLAAQDSIYIASNIVYASAMSPTPWQTNFNAAAVDDSLGLIASNRVRILNGSEINIHATIMVTSGDDGFCAAMYNQSIGEPHINLFGGVTQYRRGVVGRVGGQGFLKNYKFDPRFTTDAPPNFPYSLYVFSGWRQSHG